MITIKNDQQLALMREAGRIVALAHQALAPHVKPGATTNQLNAIAEKTILAHGATPSFKGYGGFPTAVCASVNEVLVHGFPDDRPLVEGDIVTIDIGANFKGYHGDSAWTYAVGKISDDAQRLLDTTKRALFAGLSVVKAGVRLSDVSYAIQTLVEAQGYSVPRDYTGHGIGSDLHEDPTIPNYGAPGRGPVLQAGMTLAIEPMVHMGRKETHTLMDGWTVISADRSLTAHYEHTVIVTATGCEILTTLAKGEFDGKK